MLKYHLQFTIRLTQNFFFLHKFNITEKEIVDNYFKPDFMFKLKTKKTNSTHQTSLGKQELHSCLASSSPTGWTHLVEDLSDRRVIPRGHSVLAQRLLNELQHRVLRRQNMAGH